MGIMKNAITPEILKTTATETASRHEGIAVHTKTGSRGKSVVVSVNVDRRGEKDAHARLIAYCNEMRKALPNGTISVVKRNGSTVLRTGFWNMGRYVTDTFQRTFYVDYDGREDDIQASLRGCGGPW